jgi:peptide/nickel transport system substrate-binding protein
LRPGIRYSDGRPLRAADFRRGAERLFRVASYGRALFDGIVGAARCSPHICDLSRGVVTSEAARTVAYHLIAGDPDFLDSLASHGLGFPVPAGTAFHDTGFIPIPGTGPYRIASASSHDVRYVRNPYFDEWSHAAQPDGNPDEIDLRFGLTRTQAVLQVEQGHADWSGDNVPAQLLPLLRRKYASRLHSFSIPTTDFFQFNTTRPPFDDVRVRRALNFALDRRKIERLYGGSLLATPTCQILPPGVVGYRRYCPYTQNPSSTGRWTAPDLARARRLVTASGARGTRVTVWGWTDDPTLGHGIARYTAGVLRSLGVRANVQFVPHAGSPEFHLSAVQLIPAAWGDTPIGFFATWFACDGASNHGYFCDPRVDAAIKRVQALKATNPRAAANAWAELDRQLVDRALWAPMIDEHAIDFISARVHNYQAHPYWGIMADQLWIG